MKVIPTRGLLVLLAMLLATGLSVAAKPRMKVADQGPKVDLEQIVPRTFGEWRMDDRVVPVMPSPDQRALLNKLYNQTLARTYFNSRGDRIMLSIAYGGDQSDSMQVHRPEVCYAAQGFHILGEARGTLTTLFGTLPVKRVLTRLGSRSEPVTYWVTVGGQATQTGFRQKLVQLSYGLTGKVPDGMLVRVSSISRDEVAGYALQERFVQEMLAAVSERDRLRLGFARMGS
jgi:EpsI family protein